MSLNFSRLSSWFISCARLRPRRKRKGRRDGDDVAVNTAAGEEAIDVHPPDRRHQVAVPAGHAGESFRHVDPPPIQAHRTDQRAASHGQAPPLRGITAGVVLAIAQGALPLATLQPDVASTGRAFATCVVTRVESVSRHVSRLTLEVQGDVGGLATLESVRPGSSIMVYLGASGSASETSPRRLYTPIAVHGRTVDILVKRFACNMLTHTLARATPASTVVHASWPHGRFEYEANRMARLLIVAAGSGITIPYRVIQAILQDPDDRCRITLVYQSRTRAEMLLRTELEALLRAYPHRFDAIFLVRHTGHTAARPAANLRFVSGDISEDVLSSALHHAGNTATARGRATVAGLTGSGESERGPVVAAAVPPSPALSEPESQPGHASSSSSASASESGSPVDPRPHVWIVGSRSFIVHTEQCMDLLCVDHVRERRVFADWATLGTAL